MTENPRLRFFKYEEVLGIETILFSEFQSPLRNRGEDIEPDILRTDRNVCPTKKMQVSKINSAAADNEGIIAYSLPDMLRIVSELTKFRITVLVSFTTGLGYILAADHISYGVFNVIGGIFLLACASSVLNHMQEYKTDALMTRTMYRPIPSGRVKPRTVLFFAIALLAAGSLWLGLATNMLTLGVGLTTFVWYNAVYTPLKKKSAFAIIPGSLVGALPPIAGWTAAGGNITDPRIMVIAAYLFIWQIPHFWLLLMLYGKDYEKGGFPVLTQVFSDEQLKRITFMWLIANVLFAMLIPVFGIVNYSLSLGLIVAISLWMVYVSAKFYKSSGERISVRNTFISINFYTLLLITILAADKLIKVF
jgi:protoheme IX farnesyltransferase